MGKQDRLLSTEIADLYARMVFELLCSAKPCDCLSLIASGLLQTIWEADQQSKMLDNIANLLCVQSNKNPRVMQYLTYGSKTCNLDEFVRNYPKTTKNIRKSKSNQKCQSCGLVRAKLRKCNRCKSVVYCDEACQR